MNSRLLAQLRGDGAPALMLIEAIATADQAMRSKYEWFATLNEPRRAALTNMAVQLGADKLAQLPRMLGCIRDERWAEAETHALASTWAAQTPDRARRVARQIHTGEWEY